MIKRFAALALVAASIFSLLVAHTSTAADIVLDHGAIYLRGTITKDDPARFRAVINRLDPNELFLSPKVVLDSNGGDVFAAMDIGRQIRAKTLATIVQSGGHLGIGAGGHCISACIFVFTGGVVRTACSLGCDQTSLGIHRPYSIDTDIVALGEADRRYKRIDAAIRAYFKEMNIPDVLADDMLRIAPRNVKFLTYAEAERYGLQGGDAAYEESEASKGAKHYGISKEQYYERQARWLKMCEQKLDRNGNFNDNEWMSCIDQIMRGKQ
jgi:hypothetical protein